MNPPHLPEDLDRSLRQEFLRQLEKLWPAIKGSLNHVRKPCTRPNCRACAQGLKHSAFMLCCTHKGRRHTLYVPAQWVPQLQAALRNGRAVEALLQQMGPELMRQYRKQRDAGLKSDSA